MRRKSGIVSVREGILRGLQKINPALSCGVFWKVLDKNV
jgi:hypothetical protein